MEMDPMTRRKSGKNKKGRSEKLHWSKELTCESTMAKIALKPAKSVEDEDEKVIESGTPLNPPLSAEVLPHYTLKNFKLKYIIGEGTYGKVFLVQKRDTGKIMITY